MRVVLCRDLRRHLQLLYKVVSGGEGKTEGRTLDIVGVVVREKIIVVPVVVEVQTVVLDGTIHDDQEDGVVAAGNDTVMKVVAIDDDGAM